jgi:hypothetical protein
MRRRWFAAALAATVVIGGAFAAAGFGDGDKAPQEGSGKVGLLEGHAVAEPSGAAPSTLAATAKKKKAKGPKVSFLESDPVNAPFSGALLCPKGTKVVSGYFDTVGSVPNVLTGSNPLSARKWRFDVDVLLSDTFQPQAFAGVVCLG